MASEIRSALETLHNVPALDLDKLLPAIRQLLTSTLKPQFQDNDVQRLRNLLIDIMCRFPTNNVEVIQFIYYISGSDVWPHRAAFRSATGTEALLQGHDGALDAGDSAR